MQEYILITDDSCDLPPEYYEQNDVKLMYLSFVMDGTPYTSKEMPPSEFYAQMRAGQMPSTTQVPASKWVECFEPYLQQGKDIVYLAFSSGLSGTCGSAQVAARELMEKYPGRRVEVIDSLCASLGQGLLFHKVNKFYQQGMPLPELVAWTEQNKLHLSHMVAVDDLMHLHRGGRVSKTSAVAGSLLGIKPIIHMNDEGKLVPIGKVRGRKQSLTDIVDRTEKLVGNTENDFFMICHSDCEEDARFVAELAEKRFGIHDHLIYYIGPVIGAHTGPGTVALFMMAEHR